MPTTTPPTDGSPVTVAGPFDATDPVVLGANPLVGLSRRQVAAALGRLLQRVAVEPGVVTATTLGAASQLLEVLVGRSDVAPDPRDKRFAHPAWSDNPIYRRLLQAYLVEAEPSSTSSTRSSSTPKSRERARFAVSLLTEAAAPTNTLLGNPSALAKAVETRGRSVLTGVRHLAHDVRHNGGMPSTVDTRPFTVGGNLAVTPGQVVHRSEVFELIQYTPAGKTTFARPLVAIPPQINKFYISDLAPGRSLIEHLVGAGVPYFAVSWRNPTAAQRDWNLDTYVAACKEAIEVACEITGSADANVVGMCAGAITMACLLGHLAATGEALVNSATFLVAGLDTAQESQIGMLASKPAVEAARIRSQRAGYLDGKDLAKVFAWLRPNDLVWNYWVNNYLLGQNPPAFDILYWNADTTRLPAGLHADFLDLAISNGLAEGTLTVLGTPVDLGKVTLDAYVVAGSTDHIVPWQTAYQTTQLLGGESEFVLSSSGHIQAIVNPPGNPKSSYRTGDGAPPADADAWLDGAETHTGSWWEHWTAWLGARSGERRRGTAHARQRRAPAARAGPGPLRAPHVSRRGSSRSSASTGTSSGCPPEARAARCCSSWASAATSRCGTRSSGPSTNRGHPDHRLRRVGHRRLAAAARPATHARAGPPGRPRPRRPRPSRRRRARRVVRRCRRAGADPGQPAPGPPPRARVDDVRPRWRARQPAGAGPAGHTAALLLAHLPAPDRERPLRPGRQADDEGLLRDQINARRARPPSLWGYLGQLAAGIGWTSLPWLHRIRHRPSC